MSLKQQLEEIFSKREPAKAETFGTINGKKFPKQLFLCGKLGDLAKIGKKFWIVNPLTGNPFRFVLVRPDGFISIQAGDGSDPILFSYDVDVYYEPWFMDRGSYLIPIPGVGMGKLATEFDPVQVF